MDGQRSWYVMRLYGTTNGLGKRQGAQVVSCNKTQKLAQADLERHVEAVATVPCHYIIVEDSTFITTSALCKKVEAEHCIERATRTFYPDKDDDN